MFYKNKKGYYICARNSAPQNSIWRNGRVVACTGLENRRGSHLRGFESLFLRREKTETRVSVFLFFENRQKLAFERLEKNKKTKPLLSGCSVFSLDGSSFGINAVNPCNARLCKVGEKQKNKTAVKRLFGFFSGRSPFWDQRS